jgi:hypothetical protein
MRSAASWSVGSRGRHPSGPGLAFLPAILTVAAGGCGRIPPLIDAAPRVPTLADAAPDARGTADVAFGSGGAAGNPGTGGGSGLGGAGGTGGSIPGCTEVVLATATRQPADVLLVLDRSGSMNFSITEECSCDPSSNPTVVCADTSNCRTRWASLATSLDNSLASTPFLHWGLKLFSSPNGSQCEVASGVEVPVDADAAAAIRAQIAATTPAGGTPTAYAVVAATAYLTTVADPNSKVILLVTDGKPNCGGAFPSVYEDDVTGTIGAITAAFNAGFLVYVVGIGTGAGVANLDAFAQAGGTDRHFPAQSADGLTQALASVSKVATCTFALDAMPPDPNWVGVYLDKNIVPRDASNGWSFGATAQTILFYGGVCDQALAEPPGAVQVLFGCGAPPPPVLP